jgi:PAS domain S-box-containing protein
MKVRTKLIIGFSVVVILLWLIVLYAANNMGSLKDNFLTVESEIIPNTLEINEIQKVADEAYDLTMDYVLRDLPEASTDSRIRIQELEQLSEKYQPQSEQISNTEYSDNQELLAKIDALALNLSHILSLKELGTSHSELLALDRSTILPALLELEQLIGEKEADSIVQLAMIGEDYRQSHFSGILWLLVSAGLITIIGIAAAYLTTRSIVRPLEALHKGTDIIAQGRLDYKVGTETNDEIGQLSRAFDQMTTNLAKSMTSIDVLNNEINERKKVEEALRNSEEKFSKAFRSSPNSVSISTAKDGIFIDINDRFTQDNGFTRDEVIGKSSKELGIWVKPKERDRIIRTIKEKGRVINEEYLSRTKSGEIRTMLFSAELINISGQECIIAVTTDITERKKLQAALADEATRHRILIDQSRDGIVVLDQDGKVFEANQRFAEMLGYSPEEIRHLNVWDWEYQYPPEQVKEMLRTVDETGDHFETRYLRKDGTIYDVEISTNGAVFAGQKLIFCVCRDITERKQAEEALKASQEFNTSLLENAPTQIVVINPDTSIRYVNPKFEKVNGWTADEIIGTKAPYPWWPAEMVTQEGIAMYKEAINMDMGQNESIAKKKNGELYWLDLNWAAVKHEGELQYCITNSADITERKNMEDALRIREERFSDIAENALEWLWEVDIEGKYIYSSPVVEKIMGYKPEEILEKHFYDLFYPEDKEKLKKAAFIAFKQKQLFHGFINRNVHKNGKVIYLSTSGVPILDAQGNLLGYRGVDIDITEQQKRENLQKDENYVLTLLGQGAELGELLDAIIHLGEDHDPDIKGSILLYDPVKQWLNQASGPSLPKEYLQLIEGGLPIGPIKGSCGTAAYRKERVIIPDIANSPLFASAEEVVNVTRKCDMLACWSQPILSSNGELLGTIANYSNRIGDPDPDDIRILEWSTRIAAIAIERKQAEKALKESEEKFFKAFRSSPNTIAITTIKEGRFIEVNDSFTDLSGYTREEVIGNTALEFNLWANHKDRDKMLRVLKREGSVHNHEYNFRIRSGDIRTWTFSAELIDIGNEPCMISMTTDITEQKRAEEALRDSEEKFSKAFHSSPAAISISLIKDGSFIEINNSYTRMTGYRREELIGHNAGEFNIWVDTKQKENMLHKIRNRETIKNEEYVYRIKSGDIRTVLVSSEYLTLDGEPCVLVINTDITRRKQMEEALRESEDKFNKAFHASPDIAAIVSKKDHKYLEVNENFLKFYQFTRDEVIGRSASEIGIWGNIEERGKVTEIIRKKGRIRNAEIHMHNKSGEERVGLFSAEKVSFGGEPCFVAMTVDITERKQAEEALRINEERFRLIADNATDLISRIQMIPEIKTDYMSPSCLRITGYRQDDFYNDPNLGLQMIHPEDRDFFLTHINSGIKKDQKPITVRLVRKDGQVIWIEQTHAAISNDKGETIAMHLIARDITERKQYEEQLKQTLEDLKQSSAQLAATNKELETFSYSVSHDLRSPLRSIDGFSQALLEDYAERLDNTGKDYLNRLRNASQKMGDLIDGLLKLSRLTRSEMHQEEVDLSTLVEEITSRLQENEPKRRAEFVIKKGLVTRGDPELLRALFENLLGNAWKFTKKTEKTRIEFGTTKNGKKTTYFINDNGAGFDMTYADKLFGAFQRLHDISEFPGTGIGLATVLRIINRHGGSIWAKGAVDKGATFYFTLN